MKDPLKRCEGFYEKRKRQILFQEKSIKTIVVKQKYRQYENAVRILTEKQPLYLLKDIEKRDFNEYHLDHIISVYYGFKNNLPHDFIANIKNLQMLPSAENMLKGGSCYSVISACDHLR
jgi:hypothetical protein